MSNYFNHFDMNLKFKIRVVCFLFSTLFFATDGFAGFAASQGRSMMLTGRKTELELRLQMVQQQRMYWADVISRVMKAAARSPDSYKPGSPAGRKLEGFRIKIGQIEGMLEMEANRLSNQHDAVLIEIKALEMVTDKPFNLIGNAFKKQSLIPRSIRESAVNIFLTDSETRRDPILSKTQWAKTQTLISKGESFSIRCKVPAYILSDRNDIDLHIDLPEGVQVGNSARIINLDLDRENGKDYYCKFDIIVNNSYLSNKIPITLSLFSKNKKLYSGPISLQILDFDPNEFGESDIFIADVSPSNNDTISSITLPFYCRFQSKFSPKNVKLEITSEGSSIGVIKKLKSEFQVPGSYVIKDTISLDQFNEGQIRILLTIENIEGTIEEYRDNLIFKPKDPFISRRDFALIFATAEYDDPKWGNLPSAVKGAKDLKQVLEVDFDFQVELVLDPDHLKITETFERYSKRTFNEYDQLFVFFAGHGDIREAKNGNKIGYLIPKDGQQRNKRNYFYHTTFKTELDAIDCNHLLVVIDACYSSTFGNDINNSIAQGRPKGKYLRQGKEQYVKNLLKTPSGLYLAAGNSEVLAGSSYELSPFMETLIRSLKNISSRADGITTFDEIRLDFQKAKLNPRPKAGSFGNHVPGGTFLFCK